MYKPGSFPKDCHCGKTISENEWHSLRNIGVGKTDTNETLEIRYHSCGSWLHVGVLPIFPDDVENLGVTYGG